jgi:hypothetical protein
LIESSPPLPQIRSAPGVPVSVSSPPMPVRVDSARSHPPPVPADAYAGARRVPDVAVAADGLQLGGAGQLVAHEHVVRPVRHQVRDGSAARSRTKTSSSRFVSPATRLVAMESNATTRRLPLMAGPANRPLMSLPWTPSVLTLAISVVAWSAAVAPAVEAPRMTGTSADMNAAAAMDRPLGPCESPIERPPAPDYGRGPLMDSGSAPNVR